MKATLLIILILTFTITNFSCKKESGGVSAIKPIEVVKEEPVVEPAKDSEKAVSFTLVSDNEKSVKIEDFKDNVVVLFMFGNGCTSCKATAPSIESTFVTNYSGKKVQVIGLDTWDGNLASVRAFKSSSSLSFPLLLEASSVAKTLETTYDRIVIVDKKGVVRFKGLQLAKNDIESAKKVVDEYLAK